MKLFVGQTILPFLVSFSAASCSADDLCDSGAISTVYDENVRVSLLESLVADGIPYELGRSGEICHDASYSGEVMVRVVSIESKLYPAGSSTFCDALILDGVVESLSQQGVEFVARQRSQECTTIVVHSEDEGKLDTAFDEALKSIGVRDGPPVPFSPNDPED